MTTPRSAPYGAWRSIFTADYLVGTSIGLGGTATSGGDIYWIESRPTEGGRVVLVRRADDGTTTDILPAPFNARNRVHEYGGGAPIHGPDGTIYFTNFDDQKLYRVRPGEAPCPLTALDGMRYADGVVDAERGRLICVREDHTVPDAEPTNTIVAVDIATGSETVLFSGTDFVSTPRLGPDRQLCWLSWNHPNMPWDGTTLHVATFDATGALGPARVIAGGTDESIFQPTWSPGGTLYFVSDRSGWGNLYRWVDGEVEAVAPMEAEFGDAQWVFGMSTYAFVTDDQIASVYHTVEGGHLAVIDTRTGEIRDVDTPYTHFGDLAVRGTHLIASAASAAHSTAIVDVDLATGETVVLRSSQELDLDDRYVSYPEIVEFPTEGGLTAYGYFYPPRNDDFTAPEGEKPPLIVMSHGGPTGTADPTLSLEKQYWTSRGFAVFDVDYGGSFGYGRAYRRRLNGRWGIVDMDDCVNGALALVRDGRVDADRLAIRGGSAGGYTTLCALTFRDVFRAGASHFGVGDLTALATETHKFESRYLDSLVGPYPASRELYEERSPIHYVDQLNCPVIFFQGLDDQVVSPGQAESMVAALRTKGVPVAYLPFAGEGHGFRRAENIKRAIDAELYFYGRIFGFQPFGDIEPVEIANL